LHRRPLLPFGRKTRAKTEIYSKSKIILRRPILVFDISSHEFRDKLDNILHRG
jgi:hypothetical protein